MQVDMFVKSGDTLPAVNTTLTDSTGTAIDLTTAVGVTFSMALKGTSVLVVDAAATIAEDPTTGVVQYAWAEDDTATPGMYLAAFQVEWPGGLQTYPSEGSIHILVQNNLVDAELADAPFCSVSDVHNITGQDVNENTLAVAWSVIESITGRPLYELTVPEEDILTPRDQYWLQRAIAFQSVFIEANPDIFSSYDMASISQSGQSGVFNVDGQLVAPMARRSLRWITWMKNRSVKIQRPFPYARLPNPTVNDDMGHPWNSMGGI